MTNQEKKKLKESIQKLFDRYEGSVLEEEVFWYCVQRINQSRSGHYRIKINGDYTQLGDVELIKNHT